MQVDAMGPLGAFGIPSFDREGHPLVLVFAAQTFVLPPAGRTATSAPALHPEQLPPPQEDVHWGEPGESSLHHEGQSAYVRVGTDVFVSGQAWAPRGRPVTTMKLGVRVGPCTRSALVFGDRVWQRDLVGLSMSSPLPFASIPAIYERSFGGVAPQSGKPSDFCQRNPVGRGVYGSVAEARDQPLPNFEAVDDPITELSSRPDPVGFGPVARHWAPRVGWAGTYDELWVESRAPLWPQDLDLRYFSAASPGLTAPGELRGGEPVVLAGWSPDGDMRLPLPTVRVVAHTELRGRADRRRMILDVVHLQPEDGIMTLIWRAAIPLGGPAGDHEITRVRLLEDWEDAP
ncbi:MAG: DUF2169 domain-containing protein [Myxococcales bacterium]|nr:DUF2169 domain-containing protein [Myxococcales bacterium]